MAEVKFCSVCDDVLPNLVFDRKSEKWYCERHYAELLGRRETFAQDYSVYEAARRHPPGHWIPMPPDSNLRGVVMVAVPPPPTNKKGGAPVQELVLIFLLQPTSMVEALFQDGELIHRKTYVLKALADQNEF